MAFCLFPFTFSRRPLTCTPVPLYSLLVTCPLLPASSPFFPSPFFHLLLLFQAEVGLTADGSNGNRCTFGKMIELRRDDDAD